jgi:cytochrome c oxidase assembly protein subunit 15
MGYRLPFVTTIAIFLLLFAGALVVDLDAGLACSDWPLCNGHVIPPLEGKIIIEYSHRMLTTAVGILTVCNAYAGWRARKKSPLVTKLAFLALVLLGCVAVLGGINVLEKLPPGFTTMDTSFAVLFFSTFVVLTGVTLANHRKEQNQFHQNNQVRSLFKPALIATIGVYVELVLGAFIKHSDAGKVWVRGDMTFLNSIISTKEIATTFVYLHVVATLLVLFTTLWLYFFSITRKVLKAQTMFLVILMGLQVIVGVLTVLTKLEVAADIMHLMLSVLMMGCSVFITVQTKMGVNLLGHEDTDPQPSSKKSQSVVNIG